MCDTNSKDTGQLDHLLHDIWEEACKTKVFTEVAFNSLAMWLIKSQVNPTNQSARQDLCQEDHGENCSDTKQYVEQYDE